MKFSIALLGALITIAAATPLPQADVEAAPLEKRQSAVKGMDVDFQTNPSSLVWASLFPSRNFVYIQSSYGMTVSNGAWSSENTGALNVGFLAGRVHHPRPAVATAADQAKFFTLNAGGQWTPNGQNLRGALYLEKNIHETGMAYCYGLTPAAWLDWIKQFASAYYNLNSNRWPVIYTSYAWWKQCTSGYTGFNFMDLWVHTTNGVATPLPLGWTTHKVWKVGITPAANADDDAFLGTVADLYAWAL